MESDCVFVIAVFMSRKPKHSRPSHSPSLRPRSNSGTGRRPRSATGRRPRLRAQHRWRRAKLFLVLNLALWGAIGGWFLLQPAERQQEVKRLVGNAVQGKKDITAFEVAWDLWQLYYGKDYVAIDGATSGEARTATTSSDLHYFYGGAPKSQSAPLRVLENTGYAVGYSDARGNPLWAAYRVSDRPVSEAPPRPDKFVVDKRTAARVTPAAYTGSGYDRGHLAPNYAIALHHGARAQEETFLMSNIIPQRHGLNAGLWKKLEQKIARNYPGRFGDVWVLAGPIFGAQPQRIGQGIATRANAPVAVPEACYMILVDENEGRLRTLAFIFPQQPRSDNLADYLTTIDEIEARTGLDFFSALPAAAEQALEGSKASRVW